MGKKNAFLTVRREENKALDAKERICDFHEFHTPLAEEERAAQASRCMNCGIPYCGYGAMIEGMMTGCPLHNLCPEFNDALYKGKKELAFNRLIKNHPFPEFTSRVCPALCEKACVAGLNFEAVSTRDNEYDIIETAYKNGWMKPRKNIVRNGKKAAVIGSGPSGLACAAELNHRGFEVTVYEKNDRFGGLLMYGIPNMKLEKSVIERRLNLMREEGVTFLASSAVDTKKKADKLLKEYDAVVLACGSEVPRSLDVEHMDAGNVLYAVDFLTRTTKALLDEKPFSVDAKDCHVVIVGGGDTGNDCVGTCIRMGCASVTQLEMMPEPPLERTADNPWPVWPNVKKTDYGQEEAIAVFGQDPRIYETTVDKIHVNEQGAVCAVDLITVKQKTSEDGKRMMEKQEDTRRTVPCDLLLIAAGFVGFHPSLAKAFDLESVRGRAVNTGSHIRDNLYVCGDMASGQSLVVRALASGKACAETIIHDLEQD